MVYFGFGNEGEEFPDPKNKIVFHYVVGVRRDELKRNPDWDFGFEMNTYDAI